MRLALELNRILAGRVKVRVSPHRDRGTRICIDISNPDIWQNVVCVRKKCVSEVSH